MRLILPVICALALYGAAGCKRSQEPERSESTPERRTTLRVATFEPKSIDPHNLVDGLGVRVAENLFEGLLTLDAHGREIPGAAASWTTSDDGKTWTFTLREGLTWSDGHPLTAEDFAWSLTRALDPATANPQVELLKVIESAVADGPRTLTLTLTRPYGELPRLLARAFTLPVPRQVVEKHPDRWTRPEHFVGNGPYVVAEHVHEQRMVLKKNPRFREADQVAIDEVVYRFTTDVKQGVDWYRLDEIDWSDGLIPPETITEMKEKAAPELRIDPYDGLMFLVVNTEKRPFQDARVRRALDLAIDRGRLVRQVLTGGEQPARAVIPASLTGAKPPARPTFDPAAARALLQEAGFGPDRPLPEVVLSYNTNDKNRRIAEFLQQNLKETLGLKVSLENMEWKTYLEHLGGPDYQLGLLNLGGFDAADFLSTLQSGGPGNRSRWSSPEFDAILAEVRGAPTAAARDRAVARAFALLDREMPLIPVFRMTRQALVRPGLEGFEATGDNRHPLRWMRWEDR